MGHDDLETTAGYLHTIERDTGSETGIRQTRTGAVDHARRRVLSLVSLGPKQREPAYRTGGRSSRLAKSAMTSSRF